MSDIIKYWTILQFKPNAHKLAQRNLNQQGYETFLPFEEVVKKQKTTNDINTAPTIPWIHVCGV